MDKRIEKLKALINHPNTPVHEKDTASRILNEMLYKRQCITKYVFVDLARSASLRHQE